MRCPYCREEIHDQALKCPHCQRLLVRKPGWQRRGEEQVGTAEVPVASAVVGTSERDPPPWRTSNARRASADGAGRRPRPEPRRSGFAAFGMFLIVIGTAGIGYLGGLATGGGSVAFVSGDRERVVQLEALAERRLQEIRRLQERLADEGEAAPTPSPTERELRAALASCNVAFSVLIEREAALFDDPAGLRSFVQVANRCLAPIGQQVEVPE